KKARLVRKQGTRLVPVAKARPVLADSGALWQRAFEAAFDLGDAVCRPLWADEPPSPVRLLYDVIVPDVLAAIYSMDEPVPVARRGPRHGRRALHARDHGGGDQHLAGRPRRLAGPARAGDPRLLVPLPAGRVAEDPRQRRPGGRRAAGQHAARPGARAGRPAR